MSRLTPQFKQLPETRWRVRRSKLSPRYWLVYRTKDGRHVSGSGRSSDTWYEAMDYVNRGGRT